jgi:hypothetical protein
MSNLRFLPDTGCYCGQTRLTLARDVTAFLGVEFRNGNWTSDPADEESFEAIDAPESVRLFCPDCGTYFHVPDNLPEKA